MKVNLVGLTEELLSSLKEINRVISLDICSHGEKVKISKLDEECEYCLEIYKGQFSEIKYKETHHLFRALGLYMQFNKEGKTNFEKKEKTYINSVGAMIDASRNAVYKVEEVKQLIVSMALLGHNRVMLYTEDTYEVDGYEYFGYLRGKYSKEELKEIDNFAYRLGIEVVPCIQTLAHLKQTLRWEYAKNIKDTEDVLLVGEKNTYKFIESMVSTLRSVFRSKNIHIGMDEAFDLGRGEYLTKHGHVSHQKLMIEHLKRVCEITKKYDFNPMMWDDMFFREGSPNGGYYDIDSVITKEITDNIPKEVSLVYWDYYNIEEEKYSKLLKAREKFNNKTIFAGGIWRWLGYVPSYSKTFITTNLALKQCKIRGIKEVFATAWGDDGSETPINTIILGLILFGEHGYSEEVNNEWLNRRCEFLTGLTMDDFLEIEKLDIIPTVQTPNIEGLNPSKYLTYGDILLGAFDKHIEGIDLKAYYSNLAEKYEITANKTIKYKELFTLYSKLASYLSVKGDLGLRIRKAYKENNKIELKNIIENVLPQLREELTAFHNSVRTLWYKECKGHGFEVLDIRLGGVYQRINSTLYRLNSYLNGEINKIEELEEERLFYSQNTTDHCKQICINQYRFISTQNILSW
ncbi:beta-N-acetylhexosaminidase [Clostridium tarantellae]|uniref:Family 20 glycosylhydrolase n=1 Tax=Clostridium tarantellae TaxID=39493 RepID=A0A6I1MV60_9CLOT|nr:beta-N-acetylhexosaminidase [Clostridium tarantellae]MPQ44089.1 family 20 glycosylhydrolase [Clostridium tarantellae]